MRTSHIVLQVVAVTALQAVTMAAELQPHTVKAFDQYVLATTNRLSHGPFLWLDGLADGPRRDSLARVRRGELLIERLSSRNGQDDIRVPDGLIHHWIGTVFVPGAQLEQALTLLQAYGRHERIYAPYVSRSRLLEHRGDDYQVRLRFTMHQVITVVVDSDHEAHFTRLGSHAAESWIHSTRITEIENAGQPGERERPVGRDGGYLWRLNTYWRLLARDGGLYVQCESISLTRGIPTGLGWLVSPFVSSIPRDTLAFTLETTRRQLSAPAGE